MRIYSSYLFRDKDPIIYEVWDRIKDMNLTQLANQAGIRRQTLSNWFYGTTYRPQTATVRAVLRAAGYDLKIVHEIQPIVKLNIPRPPRKKGEKPGEHWKRRLRIKKKETIDA